MIEESKKLVIKNFLTLMKECNVDVLKEPLINNEIFSESEIQKIFSSDDARHNKRVFFFSLQKKEQRAFHVLLETLKKTNQHKMVKLLSPEISGCHPYRLPQENLDTVDIPISVSIDKEPLIIKVARSTEFLDTVQHNKKISFYSSRSKTRGRVLIINNYKYENTEKHPYRNGAKVDNVNLFKLFEQMGGWEVYDYNNKTDIQMMKIIHEFAQMEGNSQFDICFVIIMGHGKEKFHETVIYGVNGHYLFANKIQEEFTNENCKDFRGKPKVFLFQACRGKALDHTILRTETDSAQHSYPSSEFQGVVNAHIRIREDILIGYATLLGYRAHRDTERGSWYIELICKNFMKYACQHSVSELLQIVDQDLRKRMSERQSMQTAEHRNKGFKNLYLNPGIYFEDGSLKYFHDQINNNSIT